MSLCGGMIGDASSGSLSAATGAVLDTKVVDDGPASPVGKVVGRVST